MPTAATGPPVTLAVAAERRKLRSAAMQAILTSLRLHDPTLRILQLDETELSRPVHLWPLCDVLLPLYTPALSLPKLLRYVALRSPLLVNNLHMQPLMQDRRLTRRVLARAGVPTPPAVYVDRSAGDVVCMEGVAGNTLLVRSPSRNASYTIEKPFVEKPVDPEDHNVYIYYRDGGIRKLFRKVKNQSSCYADGVTTVRQDGDYIYESFFEPRQHADVKIYAVGRDYFHAEARKAPHIDGIVDRDTQGRERRILVTLTPTERAMCTRVANAFDQFVLGFDLLRAPGRKRFVIDVNGWSLVKNSKHYSHTCAQRLATHIRLRLHERKSLHIRALHLARAPSVRGAHQSALVAAMRPPAADQFDNRPAESPPPCAV